MNDRSHVAAGDCERCRPGLVAQPVNTVSSLAFCVAGLIIARRARRNARMGISPHTTSAETALGWSAFAAGLGSVAYHGPGTRAGQVFHDASLLTMLGALVVDDVVHLTGRPAPPTVLAILPTAATAASASRWSMLAQVLTGAAASAAEIDRVRREGASARSGARSCLQGVLTALAGLGHLLGRTGGPLCRPDSIWQAHAVWHTAMAATILLRR